LSLSMASHGSWKRPLESKGFFFCFPLKLPQRYGS